MKCMICGQPMALQKVMTTTKMYKARRHHCSLCDHTETKFGDGSSTKFNTMMALHEAREMNRLDAKDPFKPVRK